MMPPDHHKARILFLLQRPESWINVESLWRALEKRNEVECIAWVLPYNAADTKTSASKAPLLASTLDRAEVAFQTWHSGTVLRRGMFDAVILNHPYDRERPRALWFDSLRSLVRTIVYIPYGLSIGGGRKNIRLQYGQPTQRHADLVVARSGFELEQYARYCPTGSGHVVITGLPRLDALAAALEHPVPAEMRRFIGSRTALMWNSHFSFGEVHSQISNFSTFDILGPTFFALARQLRERLCLLWRPHPGMVPALLRQGLVSHQSIDDLRREFADLGVWWDESADHSSAFLASDALATDPGSFSIEYLALRRPLLMLRNTEGEPLNHEAEALGCSVSMASTPQELSAFVHALLDGGFSSPDAQTVMQHLPMLDGRAGERVAEELFRLLQIPFTPSLPKATQDFRSDGEQASEIGEFPHRDRPSQLQTPTLDALCSSLQVLAEGKRKESRTKKHLRRAIRSIKSTLVEFLKQSSFALAVHSRLCRSRAGAQR